MTNKRISALPAATEVSQEDLLPVEQDSVSPTTGTTRKATVEQLFTGRTFSGLNYGAGQELAAAGTTQGTAAAITTNLVSAYTAVGATGVLLPLALFGLEIVVYADGSETLKVYPQVDEEIATFAGGWLGANVPQDITAPNIVVFKCMVEGFWNSFNFTNL